MNSFNQVDQSLSDRPEVINPLLPGTAKLIQKLVAAGIKLAVISNDTEQGIQQFLKSHGLSKSFHRLFFADLWLGYVYNIDVVLLWELVVFHKIF